MVKSARAKRMKKHHKRHGKGAALNLVSLMDIFTILVFFLLVNSSDVETLPNAKDLQLPESIAEDKARETVVILIGEEDIIVQGTPVAKIDDVMAIKGNNIPALREALLSQNDRVLRREATRLGYRSGFSIYDDSDSLRLLRMVIKDLDLDTKRFPEKAMKGIISKPRLKIQMHWNWKTLIGVVL